MKTVLKVFIGAVVLYVGLMLVVGLAIKFMLPGSAGDSVLSSVTSRLPVTVVTGEADFDLWQWFLFRPAVAVRHLSVGNPEGFSAEPLLQVEAVSAQVGLLSLLGDRIEVRSFVLDEPQLRIEGSQQGKTNIEVLLDQISSAAEPAETPESEEVGLAVQISGFFINNGIVSYADIGADQTAEPLRIKNLNLRLYDFAADTSCRFALAATLFDGPDSEVRFEGRAGPFEAESVAAEGQLSLELAPTEIPVAYRQQYLGDLLGEPGPGSRATLEASMKGDLLGRMQGDGTLNLTSFQLGENAETRLPLEGEAPLNLEVQQMLANPRYELSIANASMQLGAGTWQGQAALAFDGSRHQGSSQGSIRGVDINQLVAAFTSQKDLILGKAEISEYNLRMAGRDAVEMRNSLAGAGVMTLEEGYVSLFDLLDTIDRHVKKLLTGESAAEGQTDFARFFTRFTIKDQHIHLTEMALESDKLQATGQGSVNFDQQLNFDLTTSVRGDVALALGGRPDSSGVARVSVPVTVRGTVDSPRARPNMGRIVKDRVEDAVTGLLDSLFKKPQ